MTELTVEVKSLRQVDRIKSTTVGRTYELSLVKTYVSKWGLAEAVRELIQNSLDSDSPFIYEFTQEGDTWTLNLNSQFSTLEPSTLLLGYTSKADQEDSIGSFGEGYKLALLVLTRLGIDVEILNGDLLWKPRFRFSRTYNTELLVIDESFLLDKGNKGVTFYIHGLSGEDKQAIVDSCLHMQDNIGAIKSTEYGDILLDRPGKLYVGYLFVCDTHMKFGYNIKPKWLILERDRRTVSGWELESITSKMWLAAGEPEKVAKLISENIPDVEYAAFSAPEIVKEECYKIFRQRHPQALIAATPEEARKKIGEALVERVYSGGGMYHAVTRSSSYQHEPRSSTPVKTVPRSVLEAFKSGFEKDMTDRANTALGAIIERASNWKEV